MKIMKHVTFFVSFLCMLTFSCKNEKPPEQTDSRDVSIYVDTQRESFTGLFGNIEMIPLEDKKEGMLSKVSRLKKRGHYYCILDEGASPQVCLYNLDGRFVRNIGALGHSKNEYICLTDVAFGENRIAILDCNHIVKVFDYDNKFVFEKNLGEGMYFKSIEARPGGYVCISPHLGENDQQKSILYFYDEKFNLCSEQIASLPVAINDAPFIKHGFQSNDSCYFYFDFFRSTLFKGEVHTYSLLNSYTFQVPRFPNSSDFMDGSFFKNLGNYDCITREYIFKERLYAYITYDDIMSSLVVNLDKGEGVVRHYSDWYPQLFDDDGKSFYSVIPADRLLTLLEDKSSIAEKTRMMLLNCVQKKNFKLRPTDNFVIIKMDPIQ